MPININTTNASIYNKKYKNGGISNICSRVNYIILLFRDTTLNNNIQFLCIYITNYITASIYKV